MGRDSTTPCTTAAAAGFNPRARVGRDMAGLWGQTIDGVFQSTRPRGARPPERQEPKHARMFQSTRPRGARRRDWWTNDSPSMFQSTRPRGARRLCTAVRAKSKWFQSTRPRGARPKPEAMRVMRVLFQSTRPRGARLSPSWTNTNYSTKQSYIQVTTRLTKITRPAVPQFRCQGTRANIPANRHHLPFARHRARQ